MYAIMYNAYYLYKFNYLMYCLAVVVGGIDMMSQSLALAKKPHIIVGKC